MAVKIIIRRWIPKGKEAQALPLLLELRAKAITQAGYTHQLQKKLFEQAVKY